MELVDWRVVLLERIPGPMSTGSCSCRRALYDRPETPPRGASGSRWQITRPDLPCPENAPQTITDTRLDRFVVCTAHGFHLSPGVLLYSTQLVLLCSIIRKKNITKNPLLTSPWTSLNRAFITPPNFIPVISCVVLVLKTPLQALCSILLSQQRASSSKMLAKLLFFHPPVKSAAVYLRHCCTMQFIHLDIRCLLCSLGKGIIFFSGCFAWLATSLF